MKKIIVGALASAALVGSLGIASAQQMRNDRTWLDAGIVDTHSQNGGASYGYNKDLNSFDAVK